MNDRASADVFAESFGGERSFLLSSRWMMLAVSFWFSAVLCDIVTNSSTRRIDESAVLSSSVSLDAVDRSMSP